MKTRIKQENHFFKKLATKITNAGIDQGLKKIHKDAEKKVGKEQADKVVNDLRNKMESTPEFKKKVNQVNNTGAMAIGISTILGAGALAKGAGMGAGKGASLGASTGGLGKDKAPIETPERDLPLQPEDKIPVLDHDPDEEAYWRTQQAAKQVAEGTKSELGRIILEEGKNAGKRVIDDIINGTPSKDRLRALQTGDEGYKETSLLGSFTDTENDNSTFMLILIFIVIMLMLSK